MRLAYDAARVLKKWVKTMSDCGKRQFAIIVGVVLLLSAGSAAAAADRFTLTLNDEAVKDNKTGLVWEQAPDKDFDVWSASVARCATKEVGGQKGWRAPTKDELATLIDPDRKDPALPEGHPFSNIRSDIFWSSTPHASDDILAYYVSFFTGQVISDQKSQTRRMWCVLGKK
jgi:hypothetical protein